LRVLLIQLHFRQQTTHTLLKLAVLGDVDERVDHAVDVDQYNGELNQVVITFVVDNVTEVVDSKHDLVWGETHDESAAYDQ